MKIFILAFFIIISYNPTYSQKQAIQYNSNLATTFDKLNNKLFSPLLLEDTSGSIINTANLIGKTIYVDFWFTTCPPCIKEIPYSRSLQEFFATDTNMVFLNICIENIERKQAWKQMIRDKQMTGIHLFYARNRPQTINLLREYNITFPTYLILNNQMKVIGYDAPRPSEISLVYWALKQATKGVDLSIAYKQMVSGTNEYMDFVRKNITAISPADSTNN